VFWREQAVWLLVNACLGKMQSSLLPEWRVGWTELVSAHSWPLRIDERPIRRTREGGRWILQQDEHGFQHTSPTHYPSWSSPRSHWSATGPRNQQTAFHAKTHQHTQWKLARLATCAAPVRPMDCAGQTGDTGQTVDRAGQAGGYSSLTTSVPESLNDFSRPWNKNTPKTQPAWKKKPTQSVAKQLQTGQEQTSSTTTQRHTSQAVQLRKIPQVAYTGQTGHTHRSGRSCLGSWG
jgi:hypothetical protein